MRPRAELALIYAIYLALTLMTAWTQRPLTYRDGKGWEGVGYYALAEQFVHREPLSTEGPYVFRLATPWLAAKVSPDDLWRGFQIVNVAANTVAVLLLWLWLRRHIRTASIRVLLIVIYLIQWDAPTRWIWFYRAHADPWLFATLFGGLLLVDHYRVSPTLGKWLGLCALSIVGVLNREVSLLVAVALIGVGNPLRGLAAPAWPRWRDFVPLALGLATFVTIKKSVHQTDGYSFLTTVVDFLYNKGLGSFAHAWLLAFGPVLFIVLYDWRRAWEFLCERQDLAFYFLTCVGFGYVGGTDTERLLYWSIPVVLVLLGRAIERLRPVLSTWPAVIVLGGGQVLSSRILWTTPDYPTQPQHTFPVLQQFGSNVQFLDLFSYHGFKIKEAASLAEYLVLGVLVLWLMWRREQRLAIPSQALQAHDRA
jgi:hypothetical protein